MSRASAERERKVHTYSITVGCYDPVRYVARSAGKARAKAWRDYTISHECSFRDFLNISSIMHLPNTPPVGTRIIVGGEEATHCGTYGQYVQFMRDGDDFLLCSHPLDVTYPERQRDASGG